MSENDRRLKISAVDPEAYKPLYALEKYVNSGSLGVELIELVKIRASQINGCAHCLDKHLRDARANGIDQRKLDVLPAWYEAKYLYTDRECAALALTEEITLISQGGVSDEAWDAAKAEFTELELVQLLMAISAINTWNRLAISTRQGVAE
ncbi:MAG: carboxymuconolactone decarboxylase family protein [Microbacteriaceae bacterium]|nr:carboxymuconolactone decarboxylase family protein [Microbacteriaceae bacterium]